MDLKVFGISVHYFPYLCTHWPVLVLSCWRLYPLDIILLNSGTLIWVVNVQIGLIVLPNACPNLVVFGRILVFWYDKISQDHLINVLTQTWNQYFSWSTLVSLSGRWLENTLQVPEIFNASWLFNEWFQEINFFNAQALCLAFGGTGVKLVLG